MTAKAWAEQIRTSTPEFILMTGAKLIMKEVNSISMELKHCILVSNHRVQKLAQEKLYLHLNHTKLMTYKQTFIDGKQMQHVNKKISHSKILQVLGTSRTQNLIRIKYEVLQFNTTTETQQILGIISINLQIGDKNESCKCKLYALDLKPKFSVEHDQTSKQTNQKNISTDSLLHKLLLTLLHYFQVP